MSSSRCLLSLSFFFLMIRRPPRSTLFPYNDALPISQAGLRGDQRPPGTSTGQQRAPGREAGQGLDRKSTRLNSSHVEISYAVFCLKKKKKKKKEHTHSRKKPIDNNDIHMPLQ